MAVSSLLGSNIPQLFGSFGQMVETANQPTGLLRGLENWNALDQQRQALEQARQSYAQQQQLFPGQLEAQRYGNEYEKAKINFMRQLGLGDETNQADMGTISALTGALPAGYQNVPLATNINPQVMIGRRDPTQPQVMGGIGSVGMQQAGLQGQPAQSIFQGSVPQFISQYSPQEWQRREKLDRAGQVMGFRPDPEVAAYRDYQTRMAELSAQIPMKIAEARALSPIKIEEERALAPMKIAQAQATAKAQGQVQQEQAMAKDMRAYQTKVSNAASNADSVDISLKEATKSYDDAWAKGLLGGALTQRLDSSAQEVSKSTNDMLQKYLAQYGGTGMGRIMQSMVDAAMAALPNAKLNTKAFHTLVDRIQNINELMRQQAKFSKSMQQYTNDPTDIQMAFQNAVETLAPVDKKGNLHTENLQHINEFVNKKSIDAIKQGQPYIPKSVFDKISKQDYILHELSPEKRKYLATMLKQGGEW